MNILLTVISYGAIAFEDFTGLHALTPEAEFRSAGQDASTTATYVLTRSAWDSIRPKLRDLAKKRMPIAGTTRTQPTLEYSISYLPGGTPRLHQVEPTAPVSVTVDGVLTLRGASLLAGRAATLDIMEQSTSINPGTTGTIRFNRSRAVLRITALQMGPIGNLYGVRILPASGAGSVSVTLGTDGVMLFTVTPAAGADDATSVAAQIMASAANVFISATALVGTSRVAPTGLPDNLITAPQMTRVTHAYLSEGDGGGLAILDLPVVAGDATNRLRITAQKSGNPSNRISVQIRGGQLADSVAVTSRAILINRIAATTTLANLAAALNGNAAAAALARAAVVGAGSLGDVAQTYLAGGAGEEPVATIAGAPAVVTEHSDTSMIVSAAAADIVTAGGAAGEEGLLQVFLGEYKLTAQVTLAP